MPAIQTLGTAGNYEDVKSTDGVVHVKGSGASGGVEVESSEKPACVLTKVSVLKGGTAQEITFANPAVGFALFNGANLNGKLQVSLDNSTYMPMTPYGYTAEMFRPPAGYTNGSKFASIWLKNTSTTSDISAYIQSWEVS